MDARTYSSNSNMMGTRQMLPQQQPPGRASELVPGRLFFVLVADHPRDTVRSHYFCIDDVLVYDPFFNDFGPLNLAMTKRFIDLLDGKLQDPNLQGKTLYYYSLFYDPQKATNAATLSALYLSLRMNLRAHEAVQKVSNWSHCWIPFNDASPQQTDYVLQVSDVVAGVLKAVQLGWFDVDNFNADSYEHYEQLINGDWNWIVPNKFVAFSGPNGPHTTFTTDQYVHLFSRLGVNTVIRLNKKMYDSRVFTQSGFSHYDLFFTDGSCPPDNVVEAFLSIAELPESCIAVHCKAGLGRTGTLIALYLMKNFSFTPREAIGWIRVCRPGSIIGQQQQYLDTMVRRVTSFNSESGSLLPGPFLEPLIGSNLDIPFGSNKVSAAYLHRPEQAAVMPERRYSSPPPAVRKAASAGTSSPIAYKSPVISRRVSNIPRVAYRPPSPKKRQSAPQAPAWWARGIPSQPP